MWNGAASGRGEGDMVSQKPRIRSAGIGFVCFGEGVAGFGMAMADAYLWWRYERDYKARNPPKFGECRIMQSPESFDAAMKPENRAIVCEAVAGIGEWLSWGRSNAIPDCVR